MKTKKRDIISQIVHKTKKRVFYLFKPFKERKEKKKSYY